MTEDTMTADESDGGDRQFVTALARGLDILGCFRPQDRFLSNHEISRRTGLARPTVSRLTYTLTKTGHLMRDEASGAYRLAAQVLRLGFSVLGAMDLAERCSTEMEALQEGANPYVSVALAERSGTRAVYLAVRRRQQAVSLSIDVGARLPLFYSAIGRAILVGMAEGRREEALCAAAQEFPEQRERMKKGLEDALADYERFGYCTNFGVWKPEINAIAAPLRSLDGTSIYGLNVGGPSFLVGAEALHRDYGPRLVAAVGRLGGVEAGPAASVRRTAGPATT